MTDDGGYTEKDVIFKQLDRIALFRAQGKGALDSIQLLSTWVPTKLKTREYEEAFEAILRDGPETDEVFFRWSQALTDLLHENEVWLKPQKKPEWGKKLAVSR